MLVRPISSEASSYYMGATSSPRSVEEQEDNHAIWEKKYFCLSPEYDGIDKESSTSTTKKELKDKVTLIRMDEASVEIEIDGVPTSYETKYQGRQIQAIKKAAREVFQQHSLRGPLKAKIEFIFSPQLKEQGLFEEIKNAEKKGASIPYKAGPSVAELGLFVMKAFSNVTHRDSGQFVDVEMEKKWGSSAKTRIVFERVKSRSFPLSDIPGAYTTPSQKCTNGIDLCKRQGGSEIDIAVYQQPTGYRTKGQKGERADLGKRVRKSLNLNESSSFSPIKGAVDCAVDFFIHPGKGLRKRVRNAQDNDEVLIHTTQPNLFSLSHYMLTSLENVTHNSAGQIASFHARKGWSLEHKTHTIIKSMALEEDHTLEEKMKKLSV